ncbi:MAG: DUF808 domain-containing protein [Sphingobacteriaceae bacterium]|nr:MAG: DUF808 domain-containing protein [Sphingobacteriaceae bacterium]
MASGFFAVLDDITALMDDVAVATKLATRKTAGILGDDLAVNAEKATGFMASRELPVLWAITKGSFINKLIIVPIALLLNAFLPSVITVVLLLGGFYLAYEGAEKIIHYLFHRSKTGNEVIKEAVHEDPNAEKTKVRSAVTTDFILSVEIVIIALGTVAGEGTTIQIITVSAVALLATIGVYGIVALLVRMDDAGLQLIKKSGERGFWNALGTVLVKALPIIIRFLAVVGTIALILVSGGIFAHNIDYLHHLFTNVPDVIREFIFGLVAGLIAFALVSLGKNLFKKESNVSH